MTHLRQNAVAYVALFLALGGTGAWAAATIGPSDIEKNAVRSKHVAAGQVKPGDTALTKSASATDEVTYDAQGPLADPVVSVNAKEGDLILYHANAALRRSSGGESCAVNIQVDGPGFQAGAPAFSTSQGFNDNRFLATSDIGTSNRAEAAARSVPASLDGTYEVSMVATTFPGTECVVADRAIWVSVLR